MAKQDKIDLFKLHKNEYGASRKPRLVTVGAARYLAVDGAGAPAGTDFQEATGALYAAAYTIKMASKTAGRDYAVCKLEAIWWTDAGDDSASMQATPVGEWRWSVMIRTPEFIGKKELRAAAARIEEKGKTPGIERVRLEKLREGSCVQALHVGPYDQEEETIALLEEYAAGEGLALRGRHHEVYLSDPRRVEPERLKTILRHPVA